MKKGLLGWGRCGVVRPCFLIQNKAEQILYFYNASGLVTEVWYEGSPKVKFMYNDRNHRVKKESYHNENLLNSTFYVRDVAGQVMAIYTEDGSQPQLVEQPIYGAGRIGVAYASSSAVQSRSYVYELTDHLGNVRAVFTKESATDGDLEGYTDYYPFGMPMPQRQMTDANQYRYAFQGQEMDDETGNEAFELRLWDSRIGRWLSPDPSNQYHSPYLGMGNNAMNGIESRGSDWWQLTKDGQLVLIKETSDPFNIFFDSEGQQIANTSSNTMPYLRYLDDYGPDYKYGKNHEFIKLRMAQIDLISLALYNDSDVYNKMVRRAQETHWKNPEVLPQAREAGNLPAKKAASSFVDVAGYVITLIATKKPWSSTATGLNAIQKGTMTYKFGGFIEATFDQSDLKGLQERMGEKIYGMQQDFINNYPMRWNFLSWNLGSTREKNPCRCNN